MISFKKWDNLCTYTCKWKKKDLFIIFINGTWKFNLLTLGLWWSWSYDSWIYNYCAIRAYHAQARCTWYNIMWSSLSVTCDRYSGFLHHKAASWPLQYIAEILLKVALNTITLTYYPIIQLIYYYFSSCCQRDRLGPYFTSDMSWLTPFPVNPLAIGQYVNNQSTGNP